MGLFTVLSTAATSLSAQAVRLNVTASNLANADSVSSSVERTYRARHPVFAPLLAEGLDGGFPADGPEAERALGGSLFGDGGLGGTGGGAARGVRVAAIVESQAPLPREYRPDHPLADAEGYIVRTNVNVVEEMADMMSASRTYQSSLQIIDATKQLLLRTLSLGQ